jgi:hypothetical protein
VKNDRVIDSQVKRRGDRHGRGHRGLKLWRLHGLIIPRALQRVVGVAGCRLGQCSCMSSEEVTLDQVGPDEFPLACQSLPRTGP